MIEKRFDCKFIILAIAPSNGSILHFCGYFNKPYYIDYINLHKELKEDTEFGLQGVDFCLAPAHEDDVPKFIDFMKKNESGFNVIADEGHKND